MTTAIQHSLSGGELAPALYSRTDHTKYSTSVKTLRNFIVAKGGGVKNRPGTTFIQEVANSSAGKVRLIPFIAGLNSTYVLELGNQYMRFIQNGQQVLNTTIGSGEQVYVTGISNANPCVVTFGAVHGYTNGQEITFIPNSLGGMIQLYGRNFKVVVIDTTHVSLQNLDGTVVDSTSYGIFSATIVVCYAQSVYQISTPYSIADLPLIKFDESNFVMTLDHPSYPPQQLTCGGPNNWTLIPAVFASSILTSAGFFIGVIEGGSGSSVYKYMATVFNNLTGEESYPIQGSQVSATITGYTNANPCVITVSFVAGSSFAQGELCALVVPGCSQLDSKAVNVTKLSSTTYSLNGIDSTSFPAFSSNGKISDCVFQVSCAPPTTASPNSIIFGDFPTPSFNFPFSYNIYLSTDGGNFGFIGSLPGIYNPSVGDQYFLDTGIDPDTSHPPPTYTQLFQSANNYPSNSCYYQQRHVFANSNNQPENVWASEIGLFSNYSNALVPDDSDPVLFQMAGTKINFIQNMLDMGELVIFTSFGEYACAGGTGGALTPTAINSTLQSYNGSAYLRPVIANGSAIYLQARGSVLRDLLFDFITDTYHGNDLTIFANHLFDGFTIVDMDFAPIPNSILYVVRSDGTLLTLTYLREEQIVAWAHQDTNGLFENVCVVPEGSEDAVYVVVNRSTAWGETKRFIERFQTRTVLASNIQNAVFMDSSLIFDGSSSAINAVYGAGSTMKLTGGTIWGPGENITLFTQSNFPFAASMIGHQFLLTGSDGNYVRVNVVAFTDAHHLTVQPVKNVPASLQNIYTGNFTWMPNSLNGLWRLNGQTVSCYGDSAVVASPNNIGPQGQQTYPNLTISNGSVTLPHCYGKVVIGLPYLSDLETLNVDVVGYSIFAGQTMIDKNKQVSRIEINAELTRALWAGPQNPDFNPQNVNGYPLFNLTEKGTRKQNTTYDSAPQLFTEPIQLDILPEWNSNGRVFFRIPDPVPVSILSVAIAGYLPMRQ